MITLALVCDKNKWVARGLQKFNIWVGIMNRCAGNECILRTTDCIILFEKGRLEW